MNANLELEMNQQNQNIFVDQLVDDPSYLEDVINKRKKRTPHEVVSDRKRRKTQSLGYQDEKCCT